MKLALILIISASLLGLLIWQLDARFPNRLGDDFSQSNLVYMLAFLTLIGPGIVMTFRHQVGKAVIYLAIWGGLMLAVVTAYAFREEFAPVVARVQAELMPASAQTGPQGEIVITRAQDGHFYVEAFVNGQRVTFMVDTGASHLSLSHEDAQRASIAMDELRYTIPVNTANGIAMNAYVTLESVAIPPIMLEGINASVAKEGQLSQSLLGMNFLDNLGGYRVEGDRMILWR